MIEGEEQARNCRMRLICEDRQKCCSSESLPRPSSPASNREAIFESSLGSHLWDPQSPQDVHGHFFTIIPWRLLLQQQSKKATQAL